MNTKKIVFIFAFSVLFFASCTQIQEVITLTKCDFRLKNVTSLNLDQIELLGIKSYSDINLLDIGKLGLTFASGTLPLGLKLDLEIRNPNSAKAALNRLDWIILIDQNQVADGSTNFRVEVAPNGGTGTMPLYISTDLKKVLSGQSLTSLINLVLNFFDAGGEPSRITIKVKPWIMIGNTSIAYPAYINIKKEFGSQ